MGLDDDGGVVVGHRPWMVSWLVEVSCARRPKAVLVMRTRMASLSR